MIWTRIMDVSKGRVHKPYLNDDGVFVRGQFKDSHILEVCESEEGLDYLRFLIAKCYLDNDEFWIVDTIMRRVVSSRHDEGYNV